MKYIGTTASKKTSEFAVIQREMDLIFEGISDFSLNFTFKLRILF